MERSSQYNTWMGRQTGTNNRQTLTVLGRLLDVSFLGFSEAFRTDRTRRAQAAIGPRATLRRERMNAAKSARCVTPFCLYGSSDHKRACFFIATQWLEAPLSATREKVPRGASPSRFQLKVPAEPTTDHAQLNVLPTFPHPQSAASAAVMSVSPARTR